jgi:hypothetical protein
MAAALLLNQCFDIRHASRGFDECDNRHRCFEHLEICSSFKLRDNDSINRVFTATEMSALK